jgi:hypothetical protein
LSTPKAFGIDYGTYGWGGGTESEASRVMVYPPISLAYLRSLTDCTGIIQHGWHSVPNRKLGYTTDDNARALIVAAKHYGLTGEREDLDLATVYLGYLHYASTAAHKFRNVMSYQRVFMDQEGTQDCYGRAIWGCGSAASSSLPENTRIVARKLFEDSIGWVGNLTSPRARAYAMIGMREYLRRHVDFGDLRDKIDALGDSLLAGLKSYATKDWDWFEPYMTYGNAILPLGMLVAAEVTGRKSYMSAALRTIRFLTDVQMVNDRLEIVGNDGWYQRGQKRAWYDQQTIDAGYTVYLYSEAYSILNNPEYIDLAKTAFSWFLGNNRAEVNVYDEENNGCFDGINPEGLNLNQGAESIVCYLLARLAMHELKCDAPRPSRIMEAEGTIL